MDKKQKYTAKTLKGLEEVLAEELTALGAKDINIGRRAVLFSGDKKLLYKTNLNLRTAISILKPIFSFEFKTDADFFKQMLAVKWDEYLNIEQTFAIRSTVFSEIFSHTKYPALRMKDAVADWFRSEYGRRPSVDVEQPNILFDLHISQNEVTVSLDSSGDSLNKRAYRLDGWKAPLNEVLAAGMIMLSKWDKKSELHNPMCGSGTIAIEAAMLAANIPPNYRRAAFGFHHWPDFDDELWKKVYTDSVAHIKKKLDFPILANDMSPAALRISTQNATAAGVENMVEFIHGDFTHLRPEGENGLVFFNPPYGERLKESDIDKLYTRIGDHLKKAYEGFDAWIISGNLDAIKKIGLKSSQKITIFNGKIETRFVKFGLYSGTKKIKTRE